MSYKDMNYEELAKEAARVKHLLATDKRYFTQKQNKTYLEKLERRIKEYELLRHRD